MTIVTNGRFLRNSLLLLSGLLIWAAHFTFVYVFNALACARHFANEHVLGIGLLPAAIGGATIAALGAIGFCLLLNNRVRSREPEQANDIRVNNFMNYMTVAIGLLGALAVVLSGLPVLFLPPCG